MSDEFDVIANPSNPLDGAAFSAGPGPMLVMAPVGDCARLALRIARKDLAKAVKAFGRDIPARIGEMSSAGEKTALCLGPDEWLLLAGQDEGEEIIARFTEISERLPIKSGFFLPMAHAIPTSPGVCVPSVSWPTMM